MKKLIYILLFAFLTENSQAQNSIIYNNLAAHLQRRMDVNANDNISFYCYYLADWLKTDPAVQFSLKKMDTTGMQLPLTVLRIEALKIYFNNTKIDSTNTCTALLQHFNKIDNFVCQHVEKYKPFNATPMLDENNFANIVALFYRDTTQLIELNNIIQTDKLANIGGYHQNKTPTLLRLAKTCMIVRNELILKVFEAINGN